MTGGSGIASLGDLSARVGTALAGTATSSTASESALLLDGLGEADSLRSLLRMISADEGGLERIAARSYPHALGFDKVVLTDHAELGQLRLHMWWPGVRRAREHIHDHRAPFVSRVVYGRLASELFERGQEGPVFVEFREGSVTADQCWRFDRISEDVRLRRTLWMDLPAGSRYAMSSSALHRVDVHESAAAASLLVQRRLDKSWSSVLVEHTSHAPEGRPQARFTVSELADRLDRLAAAL